MTNIENFEDFPEFRGLRLMRTVALVGMMGSGKSAIGRRLGVALGADFRDADTEIEEAAGMTIPEIFERHGEPAFRDGERRVIARLLDSPPFVLATGGGAFIDPMGREAMMQRATVVWLRAELPVLLERVARKDNRPLLKSGDPRQVLARLIDIRYPIYAQAHVTVESRRGPHETVMNDVIDALKARGDVVEAGR